MEEVTKNIYEMSTSGMMFYIWMYLLIMAIASWICYRSQTRLIANQVKLQIQMANE